MKFKRFNNRGMVLPTVMVMVIVLSLLMFGFVTRFNFKTKGNYGDYISHNKYHGLAHAGVDKAAFKLKDNDGSQGGKHKWSEGDTSSFTIVTEEGIVTVDIEDSQLNP